jgi:hypothetical protein
MGDKYVLRLVIAVEGTIAVIADNDEAAFEQVEQMSLSDVIGQMHGYDDVEITIDDVDDVIEVIDG